MRLGLTSCAFPPTPKPRPQPNSTDIPILLELEGQAGFGPVPTGSDRAGWTLWQKFPGGNYTHV